MKKLSFFITLLLLVSSALFAQVSINTDNTAPDNSAMLDVKSNSKGMLIPRMTQTEIEAITNPANGLVVFCTTCDRFYVYLSSQNKWKEMSYGPNYINPGGGWYCGDSVTIDHLISQGVAPINKTVTYGTVANIPGDPSKCWITSNLGADHQATAVNDPTEASAGWYWQFNSKQGYKHDGTARTPNSVWISSISENSDWTGSNDPCTLELGTDWRIPTIAEWINVDANGGWTNWYAPWNSALKIHAAGYLNNIDGSLIDRGYGGDYWSRTEYGVSIGWDLAFSIDYSDMYSNDKAYGFSVRCVRDY